MTSDIPNAILDHVIFIFDERVHDGQFTQDKIGMIQMLNHGKNHENDATFSRWGVVKCCGPDCKVIKEGDHIIVEKHKWTSGFKVNGIEYWRTSEPFIQAVEDVD